MEIAKHMPGTIMDGILRATFQVEPLKMVLFEFWPAFIIEISVPKPI
jgi:hypothetical protein